MKEVISQEEEFWDKFAKSLKEISVEPGVYESHAIQEIGNIQGKKVLDCGVGTGLGSLLLSQKRAKVFGFDVSLCMLSIAKSRVNEAKFFKMKAECLGFKDEQFDAVFGIHLLHHTNISESIPEIYRVLKRGGKAVFVENFGFNPLLNFCRNHIVGKFGIPKYGTPNEHPLVRKDLRLINSYFKTKIVVPDFLFMKLLACRVFGFRYKAVNLLCSFFDRCFHKGFPGIFHYSYTQLLILEK